MLFAIYTTFYAAESVHFHKRSIPIDGQIVLTRGLIS